MHTKKSSPKETRAPYITLYGQRETDSHTDLSVVHTFQQCVILHLEYVTAHTVLMYNFYRKLKSCNILSQ